MLLRAEGKVFDMRIEVDFDKLPKGNELRVGNVYPVRGGRGARLGHLMILIAITSPNDSFYCPQCLFLIINKNGELTGVTNYGKHAIEERQPVGFVDGIDDIDLVVRSI